ncbi:MAG: valine--tRNA ligase [Candidatus Sungbacteria bacterium]|nr:valine--tRNA ligase [Candidatus Sungbacteria bacterium]
MSKELPSQYDPKDVEDRIYRMWEQSGFFNPDVCIRKKVTAKNAPVFSMVLPPPNVTGILHLGHAEMLAVQDAMVRFERMRGKRTLWIPGTDHAAIATQAKVEDTLYKKEGKTRHDLGRTDFLKRVEQFAQESHDTIVHQVKKMGSSLDWSREAYTLDEKRNLAVRTAFKQMYDAKLIYRGSRIVNWDPKLKTTVSDDEIEWREETVPFYYLQYGPFVIATARPETKFGDKYVVMHPNDKRYATYAHGQKIEIEWINGPITATIIKDKVIDMEFGTGVMTITPWHDAVDFDIAERHQLDKEQVIDYDGKLLPIAGEFAGIHIKKARPMIVEKLTQKGLLVRTDAGYTHRIATNSRGGGVIEPQIKMQWFIGVNREFRMPHSKIKGVKKEQLVTLKTLMQTAVKNKQIEIIPRRFDKVYFSWINNLRDWCISRQIWYGHRIPVWYCKERSKRGKCGESIVSITDIKSCPHCKGPVEQDPDTLDTWFSSGLWTFSTLGWPLDSARGKPKKGSDLATYHPTSVLETGYDIIFFWVARMILMSTCLIGEIPFKKVYLHGLIRDAQGRKMSKSLGNIIDPLDMIGKYGADATRLSLIIGAAPGNDMKLSEDKIRGYRNFTNKLWNIARFILLHAEEKNDTGKAKFSSKQQKQLAELAALVKKVTKHMDAFEFHHAAELLYHYTWHTFADKIIEETKPHLTGGDRGERIRAAAFLFEIYTTLIKLLHPFMPFVTEEIWAQFPTAGKKKKRLLMIERWPQENNKT